MSDLHSLLLLADDIVAEVQDQPVYNVTVTERTLDGIYANVTIHFRERPSGGALLDLAARAGLELVDLCDPAGRRVRGQRNGSLVELRA